MRQLFQLQEELTLEDVSTPAELTLPEKATACKVGHPEDPTQ